VLNLFCYTACTNCQNVRQLQIEKKAVSRYPCSGIFPNWKFKRVEITMTRISLHNVTDFSAESGVRSTGNYSYNVLSLTITDKDEVETELTLFGDAAAGLRDALVLALVNASD